ncbi:hypothetical protein RI065_08375 [Mycoplasmatota bacterium zrk1]
MTRFKFIFIFSMIVLPLIGCENRNTIDPVKEYDENISESSNNNEAEISTICGDGHDGHLCYEDRSYNIIKITDEYKLYKSIDKMRTEFVQNYLFDIDIIHRIYYYFVADVEYDFIALSEGHEYDLKDVDRDFLLDYYDFHLKETEHKGCYANGTPECFKGFILTKKVGEYKLYTPTKEIPTTGIRVLLYETDEKKVYTTNYYTANYKFTHSGVEYSLKDAYLSFPQEIIDKIDLHLEIEYVNNG